MKLTGFIIKKTGERVRLDSPAYRHQFSMYFNEDGSFVIEHYSGELEDVVESWIDKEVELF